MLFDYHRFDWTAVHFEVFVHFESPKGVAVQTVALDGEAVLLLAVPWLLERVFRCAAVQVLRPVRFQRVLHPVLCARRFLPWTTGGFGNGSVGCEGF